MKIRNQKKILKSKFPKEEFPFLIFILGCLIFVVSLFIWLYIFLTQSTLLEQIIYELVLSTSVGSLIIFLSLIRLFLSHIIVYENGVKVRNSFTIATIFSYLRSKFYLFEQIKSINIEEFNAGKTRVDKTLNIQLENDVYNISIKWLKNHEAILEELNLRFLNYKNLHPTIQVNENASLITIIKHNPKLFPIGRYRPFYTFRGHGKFELNCNESGNKMEPIVLDSSHHLPNRISFKDNEHDVHVNNFSFAKLGFIKSKNIIVRDCNIDLIRMISCSNITFINCSMTRDLKLKECQEIKFENCMIKRIILFKSTEITLDHCYIKKIKDWMSNNNQFISTSAKSLKTNVKKESFYDRNILNQTQIKNSKFTAKKLRPTGSNISMKSLYIIASLVVILMFLDEIMEPAVLYILMLFYTFLCIGIVEIIVEYRFKLTYKYIKRKKEHDDKIVGIL